MKNAKYFVWLGVLVVAGAIIFTRSGSKPETANVSDVMEKEITEESAMMEKEGDAMMEKDVKEFSIIASVDIKNNKAVSASFSLKDIVVKKGDKVRLKIMNQKGTHDFTIDEYNIQTETPEGKETIIEFTADKTGEFKYYCSKFNHRVIGQEGTLRVMEQ